MDLVDYKQNIVIRRKAGNLFDIVLLEGYNSALALNELEHHSADFIFIFALAKLFDAFKIVGLRKNKAFGKRGKILVKNLLTGCRKGGYGSAVKAVFERYNVEVFGSFFYSCPFARCFYRALVCFCSRI